ncbi:hypothetical protein Slin15195_G125930 [Septoria linicola]|uniref:Uncharacterized protein n=1 Tax=Septoria linicola TaxID=215465 RepID=A0A9Q9B1K3_9PEZI|nr:hypothetical protein Slin14017_G082110 [Septoria linicola]USW59274.1 hypothetical protein Slin15195_G125930 [Septoria linicola]
MPHGRLTPLGKQLRAVLANLSACTPARTNATWPRPRLEQQQQQQQQLHRTPDHGIVAATRPPASHRSTRTIATAAVDRSGEPIVHEVPATRSKPSARILRRRTRIDHVGDALKASGKGHLQFVRPVHKPDLTYAHPKRSYAGLRAARVNRARHLHKDGPNAPYLTAISLQSILGNYMTWSSHRRHPLVAEWEATYQPTVQEAAYLEKQGHTAADVVAWAEIVREEDPHAAAQKLAARNKVTPSVLATPLFVYMNLLKRPNINAHALRSLIELAHAIFGERSRLLVDPGIDSEPRFLVVVRLIRHARKVWPACMLSIVRLALMHSVSRDEGITTNHGVATNAYRLNKLMSLISIPSSGSSFTNRDHQEAALIPILQHMSEHQPPLQIDRQGYRAVIRLQLSQRKTSRERQWAELQALSWPPWKDDRTGMDALITKEDHGTSRAGQTLLRMQEAGYSLLEWEQLAGIHAGWDVDRTPTIQNRVLLRFRRWNSAGRNGRAAKSNAESLRWAARITSTRTVQEAWACYLTWEDKRLPYSPDVYLAIAAKLREEQRRPHVEARNASQEGARRSWPLLPGDIREVSPLPPSTHLETYTRTLPPTLADFHADLQARRVDLSADVLAFLVRHAQTLRHGMDMLADAAARHPAVRSLFSRELPPGLRKVPPAIYLAAVTLFARFGRVPRFLTRSPGSTLALLESETSEDPNSEKSLNHGSGIVHAIHLLRLRPESDGLVWHVILQNLVREKNFVAFADMHFLDTRSNGSDASSDSVANLHHCAGAFQAYRLIRYVHKLQAQQHINLDAVGFQSFCIGVEHRAIATWTVLQVVESSESTFDEHQTSTAFDKLVATARSMFNRGDAGIRTAPFRLFGRLVGARQSNPDADYNLPRLLIVPSPGVLHALIRALGWLSRYQNLLELAEWMHEYRDELLERRKQDRNGDEMMRRAIIALRVFLERSWLPQDRDTAVENESRSKHMKYFITPARRDLVDSVRKIVEQVEEWEGWPSDEEVQHYASDQRYKPFTRYEMKRKQRRERYVPMGDHEY